MKRDPRLVLNAGTKNLLNPSLKDAIVDENCVAPQQYEQIWKVIPLSVPKLIRQCPRCNGNTFCSSDKFRVNANKKIIDAWLIYKCSQCEFTWNNSILRRTPVSKINKTLFKRLQDNDKTLAWQYAFDTSLMQKGIQLDWNIDFDFQVQSNREQSDTKVQILIKTDYFLKIPIVAILRNKVQISRNQLEKMHQSGDLKVYNLKGEILTLKANLGKECILCVFRDIIIPPPLTLL